MLNEKIRNELIKSAIKARKNAYAPYSGYLVGAALLCGDGEIFCGCNVENASYGAANCAERTAVFKAVSEGKREFTAIAIAGSLKDGDCDYAYPCGICRQVLSEFGDPEKMLVIVCKNESDYKQYTLGQLLPHSFTGKNLE